MKHTEGTWNVSKHGNNDSFGVYAEGQPNDFAIVKGGNEEGGEAEANARLIAAAPELLEAVELALMDFEMEGIDLNHDTVTALRKAITKATQP